MSAQVIPPTNSGIVSYWWETNVRGNAELRAQSLEVNRLGIKLG
jgi:hypothetical protein